MPQGNVEIVLRLFELWNEGKYDEFAELHHEDVVVVAPEGWPEGAVSEGREAWKLQAVRLRENWQEARAEVDEIRPLGDARVFTQIRYVTRGSDEGISFDRPMGIALTLEGGKVKRAEYFWDVQEALSVAESSE